MSNKMRMVMIMIILIMTTNVGCKWAENEKTFSFVEKDEKEQEDFITSKGIENISDVSDERRNNAEVNTTSAGSENSVIEISASKHFDRNDKFADMEKTVVEVSTLLTAVEEPELYEEEITDEGLLQSASETETIVEKLVETTSTEENAVIETDKELEKPMPEESFQAQNQSETENVLEVSTTEDNNVEMQNMEPEEASSDDIQTVVSVETVTESNRRVVNWDRIASWCADWIPAGTSQYDAAYTAITYTGIYCRYQYGLSMFYPTEDGVYGGTCYDGAMFLEAVCNYLNIPCEFRYAANDYANYGINYGQGSDHYNCFVWPDGIQYLANCQPGYFLTELGFFRWEPEAWKAAADSEAETDHVHTFGVQICVIHPDPIEVIDEDAWTEEATYEIVARCQCGQCFATWKERDEHYRSIYEAEVAQVEAEHAWTYDENTHTYTCGCGFQTSDYVEWNKHELAVRDMKGANAIAEHGHAYTDEILLTPDVIPVGGETYKGVIEHPAVTHLEYPEDYVEKYMVCIDCGFKYKTD